jgi:hypothetical protein
MGTDHGQAVSGSGRTLRRWRAVALLAAGVAIGVAMTATPVSGHIGSSVTHLWNAHIKPKADARYYTKAQANARYLPRAGTAADAELLDGLDSTELMQGLAVGATVDIPVNTFTQIIAVPGVLALTYQCAAGGGTLVLANTSEDSMSFVIEIAGTSFFQELGAGNATELTPPADSSTHMQGHSPSAGVLTAEVGVAFRPTTNDCHTQAQVVVTR